MRVATWIKFPCWFESRPTGSDWRCKTQISGVDSLLKNYQTLGYSQAARQKTLTLPSMVRIHLPQPYGSIAQSVEHAAVNRSVEGSSPSVPANLYKVAQKINNMHIEGKGRNLK